MVPICTAAGSPIASPRSRAAGIPRRRDCCWTGRVPTGRTSTVSSGPAARGGLRGRLPRTDQPLRRRHGASWPARSTKADASPSGGRESTLTLPCRYLPGDPRGEFLHVLAVFHMDPGFRDFPQGCEIDTVGRADWGPGAAGWCRTTGLWQGDSASHRNCGHELFPRRTAHAGTPVAVPAHAVEVERTTRRPRALRPEGPGSRADAQAAHSTGQTPQVLNPST